MGENLKQLKVENWGNVFLQCLHMFFSKTDFCDLTLQFEENQQLKVHRLVMNACTDYFKFLEQSCPPLEDSVIIMPPELQVDVIVPIINFMYTGLLEFKPSLFHKIYKAADIMNITVLIKLLNAHKLKSDHKSLYPNKKTTTNRKSKNSLNDLPDKLPGRKLPVWKRKSMPAGAIAHLSPAGFMLSTVASAASSSVLSKKTISSVDNTPRPTRFEWPEDEDLPEPSLFENSFSDISYTSKPLLTKDEEQRVFASSFDSIRNTPTANVSVKTRYKGSKTEVDIEEVRDYLKEQKIRSVMNYEVEEYEVDDPEPVSRKRTGPQSPKAVGKRLKVVDDKENDMTINIKAPPGAELDHQKIIAELFKKYPDLAKKNKSIKLKITADPAVNAAVAKETAGEALKALPAKTTIEKVVVEGGAGVGVVGGVKKAGEAWRCPHCPSTPHFALFYMFSKHMLDVHGERFDDTVCKYCGQKYRSVLMLHYHMYTKHAVKPPDNCEFPVCDSCPHIAFSSAHLDRHRLAHTKDEISCKGCGLTFTCTNTLLKHAQKTGHMAKEGKNNFDCQYCTKRFTMTLSLFSHLKSFHANEAKKDGVVSIDDTDEILDNQDEIEEDEYIVPDILEEPYKEKVKIISDVKVASSELSREETTEAPRPAVSESSEAEALNNVATGIATSLGLVDIVVLDDNQQYILQQHGGGEGGASAAPGTPFGGNFTQGALPNADIGSTDELVMVLTDHDYNDENNENAENNSNIVVLYSHPVEGQQGQFIATTQGNLVVNSQMGLLQLHNEHNDQNGANNVSNDSAGENQQEQLVLNDSSDGQIESIEMIQREIDNQAPAVKEATPIDQVDSCIRGQEVEPMEVEEGDKKLEENEEKVELVENKVEIESKDIPPEIVKDEDKVESEKEAEKPNEHVQEENNAPPTENKEEEPINTSNVSETSTEAEPMEVDGGGHAHKANVVDDSSESKRLDEDKEKESKNMDSSAKMSILDDWDDTDSQSEVPAAKGESGDVAAPPPAETVSVNKLMDDWDEEEEVK